jgi:DNA polymerase-3 subunit delta'
VSGFELLPWHLGPWKRFLGARSGGRLHHAYLVSGLPGVGKQQFARCMGQALLCRQPDAEGRPCGRCKDCHLFQVGNHGDFRRLQPDEDSKSGEIRVDAIRDLAAADSLSSQAGGYKTMVIEPADRMNLQAANSLLKTLEEPASSSIYLLLTARPQALLPTIRSRCQALPIAVPPETQARDWLSARACPGSDALAALRLAGGAPLAALALLEREEMAQRGALLQDFLRLSGGEGDPVALAAAWTKGDLPLLFEWMGSWVADMLRLGCGHEAPRLSNPDRAAELARSAALLDGALLHRYWRKLVQARRELQTTSLQPQLLLESLLCEWSGIGTR